MNQQTTKKTSIGGSALIEGVMMRGPKTTAMAVRKPDKSMHLEQWPTDNEKKPWYKKTPFIRGVFNFIDSMVVSYKCLTKSSEIAGFEDETPSKFETWLKEKLGDAFSKVLNTVAIILGVVLAVGLFILLPTTLVSLIRGYVENQILLSFIESFVKISIFVLYIWLIGFMEDMKRTFQYHGAEHKTITCYEHGEELTVENVKKYSRYHPRCGTSFMIFVLIISALIFAIVPWDNIAYRIVLKIVFLPLVMGISYEIIKWAGRSSNGIVCVISKPGLWVQRLTTREPDDEMIECAIEAMKPCIPQDGSDEW